MLLAALLVLTLSVELGAGVGEEVEVVAVELLLAVEAAEAVVDFVAGTAVGVEYSIEPITKNLHYKNVFLVNIFFNITCRPWTVRLCCVNKYPMRKLSVQISHWNRSPVCRLTWALRSLPCAKAASQYVHWYGFSPV